jgi:hypothetical protein
MSVGVLRTIASASGRHRAEIHRRADGLLQVTVSRFTEEIVEGHGKVAAFWAPLGRQVTLVDDEARALERAHELLRACEGTSA